MRITQFARVAAVAALVGGTALMVPTAADAAYPGQIGRIAFELDGSIVSINADGSDAVHLTTGTTAHGPRWSPDGTLIAYYQNGDIWAMRANGSGKHRITSGSASDINPDWSPNGGKIVFSRTSNGTNAGRSLYVVAATGGRARLLTGHNDGCAVDPTWAATNRYVVYWDQCAGGTQSGDAIRKVNVRTGQISDVIGTAGVSTPGGQVFFGAGNGAPDVTPDGRHVVFTGVSSTTERLAVATADLSGGNLRFITSGYDDVFEVADPSVSPDGNQVAYTTGDENPQLDVVDYNGTDQCCSVIIDRLVDFPFRSDWQPVH